LSSDFKPLQEAEVAVQPTTDADNDERIEFKISMDIEGMVDIKVRDKKLNKPVPIKFKFHTGLSDSQIKQQRKELAIRHKD
jgi:molecular chaperone DnaK (HSP70)